MRSWALVAVVLLAACRHEGGDRARATRELRLCVEAIDRAGGRASAAATSDGDPAERFDVLARGCAPACPGLAAWTEARDAARRPVVADQRREWLEPGSGSADGSAPADPGLLLMRGCHAVCGPAADDALARSAPADRWATLLSACGAARFGLSDDRTDLASDAWLVLHRVNGWLEAMRRAAVDDAQLPALLERATLRALFRLPLPARAPAAGYQLAASPRGRVSDAVLYVVVTATELRVGAVPLVRLRGPQLELRRGPGGDFPGQRVDDAQVGAVLGQHAAYVEGEVPTAAALAPLVLVDAATPLARLLDVVGRLGAPRIEIAVAGDGAVAHPVTVEPMTPETSAIPVLRLGAGGRVDIAGLSDDRTTDLAHLPDELRHFTAVNAPVRRLALEVPVPATAADLVRLLDAAAEARVAALVIARP